MHSPAVILKLRTSAYELEGNILRSSDPAASSSWNHPLRRPSGLRLQWVRRPWLCHSLPGFTTLQTPGFQLALQHEFSDESTKIFEHQLVQPFHVGIERDVFQTFYMKELKLKAWPSCFCYFKSQIVSPLMIHYRNDAFLCTYHSLTFCYVIICLLLVICVSPHHTGDSWEQRLCLFGFCWITVA